MIKFFKNIVGEFLSNRIVAYVPSIYLRYLFYRYILRIKMNQTVFIQMGCYIYKSLSNFHIGDHTIINRKCTLDRRGGLYIGKNVNISAEVAIYTAGHEINSSDFHYTSDSVYIEDYVWIGTRSMIMPGVRIKKGAVVLPGAVVTHDVEAFSIVGGIPARKVDERMGKLDYQLTWRAMFT